MSNETTKICNPHLGKPAYTTASIPCEKVFSPCELQEAPVVVPEEPVDETLVTPSCVTIVFASNSSESFPNTFNYIDSSGNYEDSSGNTIIFDTALGWIVQTTTASYLADTLSYNPVNNYCDSNDQIISIVDCAKVGGAFDEAPSNCIVSIFAEDTNITLGQFQSDGSGGYTADSADQGTLVFNQTSGWELSVFGVTYTGSSDENTPTGVYTNSSGQCILIKECP